MTEHSRQPRIGDITIGSNGASPEPTAPRYCVFCGMEADDRADARERFGEVFCSQAHADEFAKGVRAARAQAAAATPARLEAEAPGVGTARPGTAKPRDWKTAVKMAVCCGAPLLALVVLAGGGGALLGAAQGVLPLLLLLACPLGMFFMMRGMSKGGHGDKPHDRDGQK